MQLKVPRAKVTETCRRLLEACDVSDINVQEVPVEEVIRQLFGERREDYRAAELRSSRSRIYSLACHSERSESQIVSVEGDGRASIQRCFASLNMTL